MEKQKIGPQQIDRTLPEYNRFLAIKVIQLMLEKLKKMSKFTDRIGHEKMVKFIDEYLTEDGWDQSWNVGESMDYLFSLSYPELLILASYLGISDTEISNAQLKFEDIQMQKIADQSAE